MKMLDGCKQTALLLVFGCLACLMVTFVVDADGRVFVLELGNSSGLQGFREAERACASLNARLASLAELRHAVVDCLFSTCTHGWLYGGTVGTTVCNVVGGALKAVEVRTENTTVDAPQLDAFCIKDKGVPCGDPPSFPNAHLQGHSGYEMGDELLYTCMPGYVMPSGHRAFSLLCDSCGEWYGLVEICVKDETESHIDYEDKFTDSYGEAEHRDRRPEEAHGEVYEEVRGAAYPEGEMSQEQQETSFSVEVEAEHQDRHKEHDGVVEGGEEEERAAEDFIGHPRWEQERREMVPADTAATTEAPVSLLSQKHLFWFPSEAFQDEGHPVSTDPVTQTTQRASGVQSEESKEDESQERYDHQHPVDVDDHEPDDDDDHDTGDRDDHNDHGDDSHHDGQDDPDSQQDDDDRVKHYVPAQHEDLDRWGHREIHDEHDDHYDMGEHEEDHDRVRYDSQDHDDRHDTYDERESYEEHGDVTDDQDDNEDRPGGSKEHLDRDDHDDVEEHYDSEEDDNDSYTNNHDHDDRRDRHDHDDHDDHHDHDDHDDHHDHDDHDDHDDRDEHDEHHEHEDHDSHEDDEDDGHQRVVFSTALDEHQNITRKGEGGKATTDETWLDGYPVVPAETDNGDSTTARVRPEGGDKPNEGDIRRPVPYTGSPAAPGSLATEPVLEQRGAGEMFPTAPPSRDNSQPSESETLDYDTQQVAPTPSWPGDRTERPFIDNDQAPPGHDSGVLVGEHPAGSLPGESGERGEMEGEMGEAICTGEDCPPPASANRGPKVAAIIVVVCAIVTAAVIGVWCYRRQRQKSSLYEMNGKGQSQSRQGQQLEMQQKV